MKYRICKDLAFRQLGEHTVILDTNRNKKVHHLNEFGSFIWKGLEENLAVESIVQNALNSYQVTEEKVSKDIENFIKEVLSLNLIEEIEE